MKLRIKEWMELRNVSQAQIAAGLGVSRATVSAWVEGRPGKDGKRVMVFPDADGFEALCLFLECTPNDLLELQRHKTPTGLIWRNFRDIKRGPGRPPSVATALARAAAEELELPLVVAAPLHEEEEVEEILLFPDLAPPAAIASSPAEPAQEARSSDELLGFHGNMPLASLREWLGVQLSQVNGQLRRSPSPELKAMQGAYTKALNKLDHYAKQV